MIENATLAAVPCSPISPPRNSPMKFRLKKPIKPKFKAPSISRILVISLVTVHIKHPPIINMRGNSPFQVNSIKNLIVCRADCKLLKTNNLQAASIEIPTNRYYN